MMPISKAKKIVQHYFWRALAFLAFLAGMVCWLNRGDDKLFDVLQFLIAAATGSIVLMLRRWYRASKDADDDILGPIALAIAAGSVAVLFRVASPITPEINTTQIELIGWKPLRLANLHGPLMMNGSPRGKSIFLSQQIVWDWSSHLPKRMTPEALEALKKRANIFLPEPPHMTDAGLDLVELTIVRWLGDRGVDFIRNSSSRENRFAPIKSEDISVQLLGNYFLQRNTRNQSLYIFAPLGTTFRAERPNILKRMIILDMPGSILSIEAYSRGGGILDATLDSESLQRFLSESEGNSEHALEARFDITFFWEPKRLVRWSPKALQEKRWVAEIANAFNDEFASWRVRQDMKDLIESGKAKRLLDERSKRNKKQGG